MRAQARAARGGQGETLTVRKVGSNARGVCPHTGCMSVPLSVTQWEPWYCCQGLSVMQTRGRETRTPRWACHPRCSLQVGVCSLRVLSCATRRC